MLAFAVMPAVIFSIADGVWRFRVVAMERNAAFLNSAVVDAQATRDVFVGLQAVVRTLTQDPDVALFREPQCSASLARAVAANPYYSLAIAVDATGRPRCASRRLPEDLEFSPDAALQEMAAAPAFMFGVRDAGRVSGREVLIGSAPLMVGGVFDGVVAVSVDAASLRFLASVDEASPGLRPLRAIVAGDGSLLLNAAAGPGADGWLPASGLEERLGEAAAGFSATSRDGSERSYALSPFVRDRAWLLAGSERSVFFDEATLRAAPVIAAPLIMLAIAVGVAYFSLDRLVVRHLVYLARLTRAYGRGRLNLRPQLPDTAPRELASLADSLGAMAESLDRRQRDLRESAETNKGLVLEVYHRVRNNLQMVTSLLNLQLRHAARDHEYAALERVRARIQSLALVHEKLYESGVINRLDLAHLLSHVAQSVIEARYGAQAPRPSLTTDLDSFVDSPERATPLALFLSEALLDALTCAIAARDKPHLRVSLRVGEHGELTLRVETVLGAGGASKPGATPAPVASAPGPGEGQGARVADPGGAAALLGAQLMNGFARQVRGKLVVERDGCRYRAELVMGDEGDAAGRVA